MVWIEKLWLASDQAIGVATRWSDHLIDRCRSSYGQYGRTVLTTESSYYMKIVLRKQRARASSGSSFVCGSQNTRSLRSRRSDNP